MDYKQKFKIIIIGAGRQGEKYIRTLRKFDFAEITAVCCKSKATQEKISQKYNFKVYRDYRRCIKENKGKADLIILCVGSLAQYNISKYILNTASAPLLIEKPVSYSLKSVKEIFKIAEEKKRILFWNREEIYSSTADNLKNEFQKKALKKISINMGYMDKRDNLSAHIENIHSVLEHALSYLGFLDFTSKNIKILSKKFDYFSGFEIQFLYKKKTVFEIKLKQNKDCFKINLTPPAKIENQDDCFKTFLLECFKNAKNKNNSFFLENKESYLAQRCFLDEITADLEKSEIVWLLPKFNKKDQFKEIESKLISLNEKGVNHIIFSGAEPAEHPCILKIINRAKKLKFADIEMQTDAMLCSSKNFVKNLKSAGLTSAFISLGSSDFEASNKDNFVEKLTGMINLSQEKIMVNPNIVVDKKNYKDLIKHIKFILQNHIFFNYISFSIVMPGDRAIDSKIVPKYSLIQPYLLRVYEYCRKNGINFINPFCGIPVCFAADFRDFSIEYQTLKFSRENIGSNIKRDSRQKIKCRQCAQCAYNDYCLGIWENYIKLYGSKEIKPVLNNFNENIANSGKQLEPASGSFQGDYINNILRLGLACNEKCVFCNVIKNSEEEGINITTEEAKIKIDKFAIDPGRELSFTGGEPTIRADLFELINYAKKSGINRIQIQTNALAITKEYAFRLKKSGLANAFIAFHSHLPHIQDKLTGLPGSWAKTLQGVKNVLQAGLEASINVVINKLNYKTLPEYVSFIADRFPEIKRISIAVLQPHGRARINIKKLLPKYSDIYPFMKKAMEQAESRGIKLDNHYCGLPLCFWGINDLETSLEFQENRYLRDCSGKERIHHRISRIIKDKTQGPPCLECYFRNFCNGVWKEYEELYGWDDVTPQTTSSNIIKIGDRCNNNCAVCPDENKIFEMNPEIIKNKILAGYKNNCQRIIFSGRETTLHPNIIDFIYCAKKAGYKAIRIKSNARMFYYANFAKKMVDAGLNEIIAPFYSHKPDIHDKITRAPGSFRQALKGLRNINILSKRFYPFKQVALYADMKFCDENSDSRQCLIDFFKKNNIKIKNVE